jgi:ubiquinol-cytochrome c reductase cytochrome b subunit
MVDLLLGGPIIAGPTLSRFYTLHVFLIPGLLLALVGLHLWMVLRLGINEWPMPGRLVSRKNYIEQYHKLTEETGIPFVPDAAWKDAVFAAAILLSIMACAFCFGPFGPTGQPDPTIIQTAPRPDFAFLWIYAVLAYLPPSLETPVLFIAPVVGIGALLLLPLLSGEGEKHWSRRPVAVLMVVLIAVTLGIFTRLAMYTPWSPRMNAWSSDPTPIADLKERTPLEREGALVLQNKQCRDCHSMGGVGGLRGPALDSIAARMTEDQIIRQVLQGGGNMPAYGNALNPAETTALVRFLLTLRGPGLSPAMDASRKLLGPGAPSPLPTPSPSPAPPKPPASGGP